MIPPQEITTEESLLASILVNDKAFNSCEYLEPDDFYKTEHQIVFRVMKNLKTKKERIDLVTVGASLLADGKEEIVRYLAGLVDYAQISFNTKTYAKIIKSASTKRRLLSSVLQIKDKISTTSVEKLLDFAQSEIMGYRVSKDQGKIYHIKDLIMEQIDKIEKNNTVKNDSKIKLGFKSLDKWLYLDEEAYCIIAGRPSMGKELTLCSDVLLSNGAFKKMGDIMVGDKVASVDGKKSKVTGVFPQGRKAVFNIRFSDGRTVKSGLDHQWEIMYREWDNPRIFTTKQLIEKLKFKRYQKRLYIRNHSGDFGKDYNILIHPYLLGVLLGDGGLSSGGIKITSSYSHILEKIKPMLLGARLSLEQKITYRIVTEHGKKNNLLNAIRELGLYGKTSPEKFIPEQYLSASKETRIELIRGLIDTDGTIEKHGSMTYSTSSKKMAYGFQRLARSLGAYASMSSRIPKYTYKGKTKKGKRNYTIYINCKNYGDFVTISHKKDRINNNIKTRNLNIEEISCSGHYDCQCISVSHEKELYITDDYIVTHNTAFALTLIKNLAVSGNKPGIISLEMGKGKLLNRWLSMLTGINTMNFNKFDALDTKSWQTLGDAASEIYTMWDVLITDAPARSIETIERQARQMVADGANVLFIDQLSHIGALSDNDVKNFTLHSKRIAQLKKELGVPIFLLAQLNRKVEDRPDKEPKLSDLKMSGSLEEDPDIVFLLYRPEYYEKDPKKKEPILKDVVINIAKNRDGVTYRESDVITFDKSRTIFEEDFSRINKYC